MSDQLTQDEMAAVLNMSKRSYLREEAKLLEKLRIRLAARGLTAQDLEEILAALKGAGGSKCLSEHPPTVSDSAFSTNVESFGYSRKLLSCARE